jgi:hypothetical protein
MCSILILSLRLDENKLRSNLKPKGDHYDVIWPYPALYTGRSALYNSVDAQQQTVLMLHLSCCVDLDRPSKLYENKQNGETTDSRDPGAGTQAIAVKTA